MSGNVANRWPDSRTPSHGNSNVEHRVTAENTENEAEYYGTALRKYNEPYLFK